MKAEVKNLLKYEILDYFLHRNFQDLCREEITNGLRYKRIEDLETKKEEHAAVNCIEIY